MKNKTIKLSFVTLLIISNLILLTPLILSADEVACVEGVENIYIITKDAYAINEKIEDIKLEIKSNIGGKLNYQALLYPVSLLTPNASFLAQQVGKFSNGTAVANFIYSSNTPNNFKITIRVCLDETKSVASCDVDKIIIEEKQIEVKNSFKLKLNCPIRNYAGSSIICTWQPTDDLTNKVIGTPVTIQEVIVTQGESILPSPITGESVSFTTNIIGAVKVKVIASIDGYIDKTEEVIVSIQTATIIPELTVDGKNQDVVGTLGVGLGTKNIILKVNEGLGVADVARISAIIITPTSKEDIVTFIKSGDSWKTSYDFKTAGQKYILKGTIEFNDINKASELFNYDIITIDAASINPKTSSNIIWISISIFIIILIIVSIIYFLRRKGKKGKK